MKDDEPYDQFDPVHHRLSSEEVARFSAASKRAPSRRHRSRELFARVPNDRALALYHHRIGEAAWQVLFELDRAILKSRGKNPVELQSDRLVAAGMHARARQFKKRIVRQQKAPRPQHPLDVREG